MWPVLPSWPAVCVNGILMLESACSLTKLVIIRTLI
jgi:hypothetical protein